jgi:hypothetical protein
LKDRQQQARQERVLMRAVPPSAAAANRARGKWVGVSRQSTSAAAARNSRATAARSGLGTPISTTQAVQAEIRAGTWYA